MLISLIGQTICTFYYGLMAFIGNNFLFVFTGFIARLLHGLSSAFVSVIAFSITSLINEGKELERATGYMELSWGIGLAVGPAIIGAFFDIGGFCLPFIIIGFVYLSGVYLFYNIPDKDLEESKSRKGSINSQEGQVTKEKFSFLKVITYLEFMLLVGCIMIELNTTDFFVPTLVNY